jgi:hypothetical protein
MLGLTANEWCLPLPCDSCDSSSWLNGLRFPTTKVERAALRTLGDLGPRFLYDQDCPQDPLRGFAAAAVVYADSVEQTNATWRVALDALAALGAPASPPPDPREGAIAPGGAP